MTFADYLKALGLSGATRRTYELYGGQFTTWLQEQSLDGESFSYSDVLDFLRHLKVTGRGQGVVRSFLSVIRHYGDMQIAQGLRQGNPASGLYVRGLIRKLPVNLLERPELDLLYQHYSVQLQVDLGKKVMLGLLLYQGLTVAELGALQGRHIWIKEKRMQIPGARKSAERMVELDPCQLPILEAYLKQRRHHSGALFTGSRRTPSSPHHITNRVKHMTLQLRRLNPRILSTAQIRASVITHWLRQHNLRQVQYMAGHKYVSSTQRYQTSDLEDLGRQIQRHHPMS